MDDHAEVVLITVRARLDPAFEETVFLSLRKYRLPNGREPDGTAEVAEVTEALDVLKVWLEELDVSV